MNTEQFISKKKFPHQSDQRIEEWVDVMLLSDVCLLLKEVVEEQRKQDYGIYNKFDEEQPFRVNDIRVVNRIRTIRLEDSPLITKIKVVE
jgi:hypothetical protein